MLRYFIRPAIYRFVVKHHKSGCSSCDCIGIQINSQHFEELIDIHYKIGTASV